MGIAELIFWVAAACVTYAYLGYPLLIGALARVRTKGVADLNEHVKSVTIVLVVRNEAARIHGRISELLAMDCHGAERDLIVVSDGSTDATVQIVRSCSSASLRLIELTENVGKAAALTMACGVATGEVLIFADARQRWSSDALGHLLSNFGDSRVGAVSGELLLEDSPGVLSGVGAYWKYEKWIRNNESRFYSTVGATGAISAVRSRLFRPLPRGLVLDDVYWPLQVVMQGYRVLYDPHAVAFDMLPALQHQEFRRKVRTLAGNFQLCTHLPAALLPWRNPVWFQFLSHKIARLLVPWALLCLLGANIALALRGGTYALLLALQLGFYLVGVLGLLAGGRWRSRVASLAASLILLNAAAWMAFWIWIAGRTGSSWKQTNYSTKSKAAVVAAEEGKGA